MEQMVAKKSRPQLCRGGLAAGRASRDLRDVPVLRAGALMRRLAAALLIALLIAARAHAADAEFTQFLQSLYPEAQQLGVSRATFDAATANLDPDLDLPDLAVPGRIP